MNILQVSPAVYPAISIGGPIYSMLSLSNLLTRKHDLVVLATTLGLDEDQRSKVTYDEHTRSDSGGRIVYRRYFGYPNFTFSPGSLIWLIRNADAFDLAILHGVWNFPIIAAALVCRWRKIPYVIFPHGTLYRETVEMRSGAYKRLMLKLGVGKLLERAARIVFTTNDEAHKVTEYLGLNLRPFVVPNIVESNGFASLPAFGAFRKKYGIPEATRVLIHYGRITQKKGIEFAIKAVAALRRQGRDVMLAIVGGDAEGYKSVLQELLISLDIEEGVIFTGMVGREEGISAMVDSDLFVLASYSENFGMAVVEAMLCGLPVVISEHVGLAEDVANADAGVVVPLADDAAPLIKALSLLLDDDARRDFLSRRGRQFAIDNYDAPAVEAGIDALLHEATSIPVRP